MKLYAHDPIAWNAAALGVPEISYHWHDKSFFLTPTSMAAISDDGTDIALNSDVIRGNFMLWFAVSHEMRHLYQIRNAPEFLSCYAKTGDTKVNSYNSQEAELDAHAWAVYVMARLFGIRPTLENQLGLEIWSEILHRSEKMTTRGNPPEI